MEVVVLVPREPEEDNKPEMIPYPSAVPRLMPVTQTQEEEWPGIMYIDVGEGEDKPS